MFDLKGEMSRVEALSVLLLMTTLLQKRQS